MGPKEIGGWPDKPIFKGTTGKLIGGNGPPTTADGANSDYYVDKTTGKFYGPKANGVWPNESIIQSSSTGSDKSILNFILDETFNFVGKYSREIILIGLLVTAFFLLK